MKIKIEVLRYRLIFNLCAAQTAIADTQKLLVRLRLRTRYSTVQYVLYGTAQVQKQRNNKRREETRPSFISQDLAFRQARGVKGARRTKGLLLWHPCQCTAPCRTTELRSSSWLLLRVKRSSVH